MKKRNQFSRREFLGISAGAAGATLAANAIMLQPEPMFAQSTPAPTPAQNPPAVNTPYPENAPLATVPPLILVNLPRLPDGLEYRFMGRHLILRDQPSNLIIDFVPGAVPVFKK